MTVKITPNDKGNPPGKLADAELHFTEGPLEGLKLIGFSIWERRGGGAGRNVTFPARQYSVNGERRSFALLRPVVDVTAQNKLREVILDAFQEYEERAAIASRKGNLLNDWKQAGVFLGALRRQGPFLAKALVELRLEERRLHAPVDDVPGEDRVLGAVAEDVERRVEPRLRDGGAPVATIALGGFDRGGHPSVAERQ